MMSIVRTFRNLAAVAGIAATFVSPVSAQNGKAPEAPKPKPPAEKLVAEKSSEADANRYCASVSPSIAEARIAWQTKRLAELDAQVRQRIADLEKVEASAREWIDKRDDSHESGSRRRRRDLLQDGARSRVEANSRPRRPHGRCDPGQAEAERSRRASLARWTQIARAGSPASSRRDEPSGEEVVMRPASFGPSARRARARGLLAKPFRVHARTQLLACRRGLISEETACNSERAGARSEPLLSPPPSLYTEPRISKVGDIVTVIILMNDKAQLGNGSDRSMTTKDGVTIDYGFNNGSSSSSSSQPAKLLGDLTSTSSTQGQGDVNRSEQIQVSVAAVVTRVLPNGNLVISGSQEVRVNYEMRQLTVAGIVNPNDISLNNTIAYQKIAEARISYGGRGRQSDFQQPSWGQQIYDAVRPF